MAPHNPPSPGAGPVRSKNSEKKRAHPGRFHDIRGTAPDRDRRGAPQRLVRDVVPAQDRSQAQMPRRRRGVGAHSPPELRRAAAGKLPARCRRRQRRPPDRACAGRNPHQLDDVRGSGLQPAPCHQHAGERVGEAADSGPGRPVSAGVRSLARHHRGSDRGSDRAR